MKLNLSQASLLALALITTFGASPLTVSAQQVSSAPGAFVASIEPEVHADISNFAHVCTGIWRGGVPSEEALQQLAKSGVRTIVDLRMKGSGTDKEDEISKQLGITHIHIPLTFGTPNAEQIGQFFAVVRNPSAQPIFVHCTQGADRTGTLIGMYRRLVQGWSYSQTYAEMREHHFKPFFANLKQLVKNCDRQYDANGRLHPIGVTAQI
jgi:protein tyrosine phosphatase (PTP) superfamily phosphohydrolase (DUF442 family)